RALRLLAGQGSPSRLSHHLLEHELPQQRPSFHAGLAPADRHAEIIGVETAQADLVLILRPDAAPPSRVNVGAHRDGRARASARGLSAMFVTTGCGNERRTRHGEGTTGEASLFIHRT